MSDQVRKIILIFTIAWPVVVGKEIVEITVNILHHVASLQA